MNCLFGYIGLSGSFGAAESGLYVDGLPDISVTIAGKLSPLNPPQGGLEDHSDIIELWKEIEKRAILKFRTLFISEINRCFKLSKIDVCECIICENRALLATSLWYLLGAEFMHERASSSRLNRFTTIEKSKAKELRAELMDLFNSELAVSVAGIDIHSSDCIEGEVEHNRIISTHTPIM